jgi:hypothetical protein
MDVTMVISAETEDDVTEDVVFGAIVDSLSGVELEDLSEYDLSWLDDSYRRRLNSGSAVVTFRLERQLSSDYADADSLLASLEDAFDTATNNGDLTLSLDSECGCTMTLESVSLTLAHGYPTLEPSQIPSPSPSAQPSLSPSHVPVPAPTGKPTSFPSIAPSPAPSAAPSGAPSHAPSSPTVQPSYFPSSAPTVPPTLEPTTLHPSHDPTMEPTVAKTKKSRKPSSAPTQIPTHTPTVTPTFSPTADPTCADCDDEDDDDSKKGKGKKNHHHHNHGRKEKKGVQGGGDDDESTALKVKEFKGELKQANAERAAKQEETKETAAEALAALHLEKRESKRLSSVRKDLEHRMLSSLESRIASAEVNLNLYEHSVDDMWALEDSAAAAAAKAAKKASRLPVSIFDVKNERTLQQLAEAEDGEVADAEDFLRSWQGDRFSGATALGAALAVVGAFAALFAVSGNDPTQAWSRRKGYNELVDDDDLAFEDLDHLEFDDSEMEFVGQDDPDSLDARMVFGGRPSQGLQQRPSAADMESPL